MTDIRTASPEHNLLLRALPDDARERLFPYLELVELPRNKVIHEAGEKVRHAYFPTDAIAAIVNMTENGVSTEVSMVGREGMVGIAIFMGGQAVPSCAVVQQTGSMYRLLARRLHDEFDRHGELLVLLLRYTQALMYQTAQTAMCNRHHRIDQQLCRLVLQSLDRLSSDELAITHEHIAAMLGVRRESVTEAALKMKELGLIQCSRGKVKVLDRTGIEKLSCECYSLMKRESNRLIPYASQPPVPQPEVTAAAFC